MGTVGDGQSPGSPAEELFNSSEAVKYMSFQSSVWEHAQLEAAGLAAEPAVPAQDGHPQGSKAKGSGEGEEGGLQQW